VSSPSKSITVTPMVFRLTEDTSFARVSMIWPWPLMTTRSSSSPTDLAETTRPFRSPVLMSIRPLP